MVSNYKLSGSFLKMPTLVGEAVPWVVEQEVVFHLMVLLGTVHLAMGMVLPIVVWDMMAMVVKGMENGFVVFFFFFLFIP